VLVLTGPPGVGKTTTASILVARHDRAVHLEADTFFRFIQSGYVEPWKTESHEQNRIVMEIVAGAAAGYAAAGYFTVVDGIVIPGWFAEPLRDALHAAGLPVAYAVLRAPPTVCAKRAEEREGVRLAESEAAAIWRQFTDLGELEENVIEVGEEPAEEVAEIVGERLASGRLTL